MPKLHWHNSRCLQYSGTRVITFCLSTWRNHYFSHNHLMLVMGVSHPEQRRPNSMYYESNLDRSCSELAIKNVESADDFHFRLESGREQQSWLHRLILSFGCVTLEEKQIAEAGEQIWLFISFVPVMLASSILEIYFIEWELQSTGRPQILTSNRW